jgi:UDPglucose 6-dehydrogenase
MRILEAVETVNLEQASRFVDKVLRHFGPDLRGKRLAVWGLAFKPRTNDMRDAPAIIIIQRLLEAGATISAYDPEATEEARRIFGNRIELCANNYVALEGSDALLLVTEWQAFRNPNYERMLKSMRQPTIFDGRNIFDPGHLKEAGFTYFGIGR